MVLFVALMLAHIATGQRFLVRYQPKAKQQVRCTPRKASHHINAAAHGCRVHSCGASKQMSRSMEETAATHACTALLHLLVYMHVQGQQATKHACSLIAPQSTCILIA